MILSSSALGCLVELQLLKFWRVNLKLDLAESKMFLQSSFLKKDITLAFSFEKWWEAQGILVYSTPDIPLDNKKSLACEK